MARPGRLRFRPPRIALPEATRSALLLAFAPECPVAVANPEAIGEAAAKLGLAETIAAHLESGRLPAELPAALTQRLRAHRRAAAALALLYDSLAADLTELACDLRVPIVFLKGFALGALGLHPPGTRAYVDLDLLVPPGEARRLATAARERLGFTALPGPSNDQHLPPLKSPQGGLVDVHFRLRGVSLSGGRWATVGELQEAGAVKSLGQPAGALTLQPPYLAAHLLAHGIEQHGLRPAGYPLLRMVGDLGTLLPDAAAWDRFERRQGRLVDGSVSRTELRAVRDLYLCLADGTLPDAERQPSAEIFLRHIVAALERPAYLRSLSWRHRLHQLRFALRRGELRAYLRRKAGERLES